MLLNSFIGGPRGAPHPLTTQNYLNFMQFFLEILAKSYVGAHSYGESWIHPWPWLSETTFVKFDDQ